MAPPQTKRPVEDFLHKKLPHNSFVDDDGFANRPNGSVIQSRSIKKFLDLGGYNYGANVRERQESTYYLTGVVDFLADEMIQGAADSAREQKQIRIQPEHLEQGIQRNHPLNAAYMKLAEAYKQGIGMSLGSGMEDDIVDDVNQLMW